MNFRSFLQNFFSFILKFHLTYQHKICSCFDWSTTFCSPLLHFFSPMSHSIHFKSHLRNKTDEICFCSHYHRTRHRKSGYKVHCLSNREIEFGRTVIKIFILSGFCDRMICRIIPHHDYQFRFISISAIFSLDGWKISLFV